MPFNTRDRLESVCLHARQMYTLTCSVIAVQSRCFKIYINMSEADWFMLLTGLYLRENMDGSKLLETSLSRECVHVRSWENTDILWRHCKLHVSSSTMTLTAPRSAWKTQQQSCFSGSDRNNQTLYGWIDCMFFKLSQQIGSDGWKTGLQNLSWGLLLSGCPTTMTTEWKTSWMCCVI